jgi:hypothetical protein
MSFYSETVEGHDVSFVLFQIHSFKRCLLDSAASKIINGTGYGMGVGKCVCCNRICLSESGSRER